MTLLINILLFSIGVFDGMIIMSILVDMDFKQPPTEIKTQDINNQEQQK